MTSKRKPYKTYTKEFKQEAIRMMESGEKPAAVIRDVLAKVREDALV